MARQGDSCSRNQGSHIKDSQTCFSYWPDNGLYGRNYGIISLSLFIFSASDSAQLCNAFLLTGAVSSYIISLFLLLLGHQIIIFQLLLGHLIIICWLCKLYLRAFQGKRFLTVKQNISRINVYIA